MGAIKRSVIRRRARIRRVIVLAIVIAFILIILAIGYVFYARAHAIWVMRAELHRNEKRREQLLKEHEALKKLLARKDDLNYIEYLARKELGLVKKGEEKYIIIEGSKED